MLALVAGTTSDAAVDPAAATSSAEDHGHASATDEPGTLALFVALLALLTAIAGVVLGVRADRRTVSE